MYVLLILSQSSIDHLYSVHHHTNTDSKISAYLLVPEYDLGEKAGQAEIEKAIKYLVEETKAHPRKVSHPLLEVTKLRDRLNMGLYSSPLPRLSDRTCKSTCYLFIVLMDRFPIPGGDLREMKPFLVVNTGLRRLGCGGRAAMGMESPM